MWVRSGSFGLLINSRRALPLQLAPNVLQARLSAGPQPHAELPEQPRRLPLPHGGQRSTAVHLQGSDPHFGEARHQECLVNLSQLLQA